MEPYQLSLIAALILAGLELVTTSFVSLSFALALVIVATVQYFSDNINWTRDLILFIVFAIAFTGIIRALFKVNLDTKAINNKDDVNKY